MNQSASESDVNAAPENTRVLNVAIPESVYWHLRQCATESRLSMKDFMAQIGRTARAIPVQADNSSDVFPGRSPGETEPDE